MSRLEEVSFDSGGVRCAADLYWPQDAIGPVPCLVMGHGGSATKRLGLPRYAAKFTARGLAVLAFDYRGWGASGGEPRQVADAAAQRDDYRAAIRYARAHPGIDAGRVAVWGTSFSGGHVLAVAAGDPAIAAVICQVPLIDGWHRGRTVRQRLTWDVTVRTVQFTVAAVRDGIRALRGLPPYLVPVVAEPGKVAVFTEPDARAAFEQMGGEAAGWRNQIAPRMVFALPRYRKGTAERLGMPVLMCLADHDLEASSKYATKIAASMPDATVLHYPVGHFAVYLGPVWEQVSDAQAGFLAEHLRTRARPGQAAA